MIFITGDTHGDFNRIKKFCETWNTAKEDIMIILGDAGINYHDGNHDIYTKKLLSDIPITFFCIHGNHENRPQNILSYIEVDYMGGKAFIEPAYPDLIFAKDGEMYILDEIKTFVIGGAYSVDKGYRLTRGHQWWADEQPSDLTKEIVESILNKCGWRIDAILTHTCPLKYKPYEALLQSINQAEIDATTEEWLDKIEDRLSYNKWFCGHFHINKVIDKVHFIFNDIIEFR